MVILLIEYKVTLTANNIHIHNDEDCLLKLWLLFFTFNKNTALLTESESEFSGIMH